MLLPLTLMAALLPPAPLRAAGPFPDGALGYDISFPQGTGPYPSPPFSIAVVGVNNGQPFGRNPDLQPEWTWAQQAAAPGAVYINTDYPHGTTDAFGDTGPHGACNGDEDCRAYNYGWNAAADAVKNARQFGVTASAWWLDVETGNWWPCDNSGKCDTRRDALDIQGGLDYLRSQTLNTGVYSTPRQWGILTGGYGITAPLWVPDFNDDQPAGYCNAAHSFGGGTVFMVQFTAGRYDGDYSCPSQHGYYLVAGDGGIFSFGDAVGYGSTGNVKLNKPVVGMATTPGGDGYWVVAADGGIFPFGPGAAGYGSTGGIHLNKPIVSMAGTPSGRGYWLVASDGGIFPFGDAVGFGSTGGIVLNQPIVGMTATAGGHGYWLVARDGGIFPFGDAVGYGSAGGIALNQPIVGMSATQDGAGYWMVAGDGGIFTFGDATGYGSAAAMRIDSRAVGMARTQTGKGYWIVTAKGNVIAFGDALGQEYGSMSGRPLNRPALQLVPTP